MGRRIPAPNDHPAPTRLRREENSFTIDLAYRYLTANDVQTVIPEEDSLSTDTELHQFFASAIWHF